MPKQTGFRVFGDVLDREDSWVDVSVAGVNSDGEIYLEEKNGDGSWTFTADRLERLNDELLMVGDSQIPVEDHPMWGRLDAIGEDRKAIDINAFVDENLQESQKALFQALLEAGR